MIVLGVTGSIAAYKAVDILRGFLKASQDVRVVMTPSATRFVGPLTFHGLSGHPVVSDVLDAEAAMVHLDLAERAGALVIAPASADTLSRLAQGAAGDAVSAVALAVPRGAKGMPSVPVFVAPAMHESMWRHPATQSNVRTLRGYGYRLIGPEKGPLGRTGDAGEGRMSDPRAIVATVLKAMRA